MMRMLKGILAMLLFFSLTGCDYDRYAGKRPIDYPNTTWVCTDETIVFSVNEDGNVYNTILKSKNEDISIDFLWAVQYPRVNVYRKDDKDRKTLFKADCIFGEKQFTMTIENSNQYLLEKKATLVCKRN